MVHPTTGGLVVRRRALTGVVALSALALAAACSGVGKVHPDVAELEALPGAGARYPGAVTLIYGGIEGDRKMGVNPANVKGQFATDGSPSAVIASYDGQLTATGWTRNDLRRDADYDLLASAAWVGHEALFRLDVFGRATADRYRASYPQARGLQTVFETLLVTSPSDGATS
jgi:hypothetical protein